MCPKLFQETKMKQKVCFHTLGCKLNFSETSTIAREFEEGGFERVSPNNDANIHVINSCSVTETANKKCRNLIHKIVRNQPQAIIAVTGCYAQLKPSEIADIDGVDIVVGNGDKGSLFAQVDTLVSKGKGSEHVCQRSELSNFFAAFSSSDRTRTFLKVQDGCNYFCSYCTIPIARGNSRNIPIADVVKQAEKIASLGQKEIVITGINTGDFGRSTDETFLDLIRALDRVEGIERYRISSIEPNLLTYDIIEFCAESKKFQPHFHIPLQSGSDKVLDRMNRRYDTTFFNSRILKLREDMPDVFLGIDVIVGFPTESDEDFEQSYAFLEKLEPAFLHVFPYSKRPDTLASRMEGQVPKSVKDMRAKRLNELSEKLYAKFLARYVGTTQSVLFESSRKDGNMFGFTGNYIKVHTPYNKDLINQIVEVELAYDGTNNSLAAKFIV